MIIAPTPAIKNVRHSLMFIGDGFRQIKPSTWVELLFNKFPGENLVISDGRYFSECDAVRNRKGINIAVWRKDYENDIEHPSESQLKPDIMALKEAIPKGGEVTIKDSPFDWFLVNDDTVERIYERIDQDLLPYIKKRFGI